LKLYILFAGVKAKFEKNEISRCN